MSRVEANGVPHVKGYDTSVAEFLELSRSHSVVSSDRGYEVLGFKAADIALSDERFSKLPGFKKRLDDIGITEGSESRADWEITIAGTEGDLRKNLRVMYAGMMRPSLVAKFTDTVRGIVQGVFDEAESQPEIDMMGDIAWRIPSRMYCEMVSVPYEFASRAARLSDSMQGPMITRDPSRRQEAIDAFYETYAVVTKHIEERRDSLSDDFTSFLIKQELDGKLTRREMHINAVGLLLVSIDNTAQQMGLVIGTLLQDREVWKQLVEDPDLIPSAVEESIRHLPRLNAILRHAEEDVELDGTTIPAGSTVLVHVSTANRDPNLVEAPEEFQLGRRPFRQLLFGGGNFNCLGQHLARLEIQEAVRALATRFPNARLADGMNLKEFSYGNEVYETAMVLER